MLLIFLFSCILYDSKIKLARRANEIDFESNSNKKIRSNTNSWYFVNFHFSESIPNKIKMISDLQKQGIYLKSANYISKNLFNLYLTPNQVNFIISKHYGNVQEIQNDDKILKKPNFQWSFLTIECINPSDIISDYINHDKFSPSACHFSYQQSSNSTFSIKSTKQCLNSIIPSLTSDNRIFAINFDNDPEVLNCRVSGFVQKNTEKAEVSISDTDGRHIVEIDRYLNKKGLDGTGITVEVSDTFLDINSTFFYDPQKPQIDFDKPMNDHRKIAYVNSVSEKAQWSDNEHGTHTAGTICGKASDDKRSISKYNGIASGSKIAFYTSVEKGFDLDEIVKTVELSNSQISSNSWGREVVGGLHDSLWDSEAYKHDDTLFVFAGGNSGEFFLRDGYQTMRSPGSAKNILTVGAVEPVRVDESVIGTTSKEVFLTEDSTGNTKRLKLFEWSITNYNNNVGLKTLFELGTLKVTLTRSTSGLSNTTVLIIDSKQQFDQLSKENPPYYVISTVEFDVNNFMQLGFKRTFPVMFINNSSLPTYTSNRLYTNYRVSKGYKRADFSSKGTGNLGLMKPDVMCPGVSVLSSKSVKNGLPNHEELTIKFGTSMATPVCAGAAAIVYQYFADGHYRKTRMKISAALARCFMITCSDPITSMHPNADDGYGLVNVGKFIGNGDDVDNKRILVGDRLKITSSNSHIMSTFSVLRNNDRNIDLRVTLSYLDPALSADSSASLAVDLDLVLVSPSGIVYRGNMRVDDTEERYSTNERIIVNSSDIEDGNYEIHVFASIPSNLADLNDQIEFAMTIFGPLNDRNGDKIIFNKATKCIPSSGPFSGMCNTKTTENECSVGYYGRSCQSFAYEYFPDIPRDIISIPPFGIKYVVLYLPFFAFTSINFRVTPATTFEPKISVFYRNTEKAGSEIEADLITSSDGYDSTFYFDEENWPEGDIYALVMIYNTSPYPTDFVISSKWEDNTEPVKPPTEASSSSVNLPTESSQSSSISSNEADCKTDSEWNRDFIIAASLAIAFGVIMLGLVVALIIVLVRRKKKDEYSVPPRSLNDSLI